MTEEQKVYYKNKICPLCTKKNYCSKDKFISLDIYDNTSLRCPEYEYNKEE